MTTASAASRTRRRTIVAVVVGIVVLLAINLAVSAVVRDRFRGWYIPSESMTPALKVGDRIATERLSYALHDPRRGDIVVFDAPPAAAAPVITTLIQRIVGMPGEEIEGRDGHIFVDGRRLEEPYLRRGVQSRTFGPERIPDDSYFVLGDNRQFSKDSTFYGPIARDTIIARAFLRYAPPNRIGTL